MKNKLLALIILIPSFLLCQSSKYEIHHDSLGRIQGYCVYAYIGKNKKGESQEGLVVGCYRDDKKIGLHAVYEDTSMHCLAFEYYYINGKLQNKIMYYYGTRKIKNIFHYEKDKIDLIIHFSKNGRRESVEVEACK